MDKWFGMVRWCREDVESAILERGLEASSDFVDTVMNDCMRDRYFTDAVTQAGWDSINHWIDQDDIPGTGHYVIDTSVLTEPPEFEPANIAELYDVLEVETQKHSAQI